MARAHDFALRRLPGMVVAAAVIGALTLVYLLGVILHRGARRADPVVDAYWKLLEKRSAWMPDSNENPRGYGELDMSAAATAAGYLYASGRLRGRGAREQEHHESAAARENEQPRTAAEGPEAGGVRVAVHPRGRAETEKPRRTPKIEYRTRRRWSAA